MAEKGQGSASKVSLKPKAETVCRFYEKGECRHGSDCPFLHPSLDEEYRAPEPEQHDSYEAKEGKAF